MGVQRAEADTIPGPPEAGRDRHAVVREDPGWAQMRLGGTQDRVGIEPAFTQRSVVGQDALDLLPQEAARALAHGVERPPQVEDLRESLAPVAGKRASERPRLQQAS